MEHWWYDTDSESRGTQRKPCLSDTLYLGADQYLFLICEWQVEVWIQVFWHVTLCLRFSGSRRFEEMRGLFRKEVRPSKGGEPTTHPTAQHHSPEYFNPQTNVSQIEAYL